MEFHVSVGWSIPQNLKTDCPISCSMFEISIGCVFGLHLSYEFTLLSPLVSLNPANSS